MLTISEVAAILAIWALTAAGVYFGVRAAWRRRKRKQPAGYRGGRSRSGFRNLS